MCTIEILPYFWYNAGMEIIYDDKFICVCVKDAGVLSENGGMPELLKEKLGIKELFCVHRLDRDVGGVMVYAKTSEAAAKLSAMIAERRFRKEYLAVVEGLPEKCGEMRDLLFHDAAKNKTYVVNRLRRGVKEAVLEYETLDRADGLSLVRILLHTGRSHQIRVQFASRKMPLCGDGKYGSFHRELPLSLWAFSLSFPHPKTGKILHFSMLPPCSAPWNRFDSSILLPDTDNRSSSAKLCSE